MANRTVMEWCLGVALLVSACDPARVCSPGSSVACVGPGGCAGGQVCTADGSGYGACDCGGGDAGTDAGAPVDVGPDASDVATDAPAAACDPIANTGCAPPQRCAWVSLEGGVGEPRCVANGTVAEGEACDAPSIGEADDCEAGTACVGTCERVCTTDPDSCPATAACVTYSGLFERDGAPFGGVCNESCDPITGARGSGTCPSGTGCYASLDAPTVPFVCAPAGSVAVGATFTGTPFANRCVPGATPVADPDGTTQRCVALCRPLVSSSASPGDAVGEPPYSCPEVGGAPGADCVFGWVISRTPAPAPRLDTIGVCWDRAGRSFDDDGDGAIDDPQTSCATRAATDDPGDPDATPENAELGCAPYPG